MPFDTCPARTPESKEPGNESNSYYYSFNSHDMFGNRSYFDPSGKLGKSCESFARNDFKIPITKDQALFQDSTWFSKNC